jgi:hypothetical protein
MFQAPLKVGLAANLSHLAACARKDVSPAVSGHCGGIAKVAAKMFCFKLRLSTDLVKYNRESDYFSGPIILATDEVAAYSATAQLQLRLGA